mmetsp:Transcript_9212/g.19658  ORF Transcript_9212/g.19658 Transcript_9212/m.19658 type:complete len:87 (-) Transcript_9212:27-287(-)
MTPKPTHSILSQISENEVIYSGRSAVATMEKQFDSSKSGTNPPKNQKRLSEISQFYDRCAKGMCVPPAIRVSPEHSADLLLPPLFH